MKIGLLHLRQFFQNNLLRKAEGYGPTKPWQPYRNSHPVEGANSILHSGASGWAERDKSEIKFDKNRISIHFKLILTYRMSFFCTLECRQRHRINR
jgi:hypothetical protein